MKNILFFIAGIGILCVACNNNSGHSHSSGSNERGDEVLESYTVYTNNCEFFVKFHPLVKGQATSFLTYISGINDFKPVANAKVTVNLVKGKKGIRQVSDKALNNGVYAPSLQPKDTGVYELYFDISTPGFSEKIIIGKVNVYDDEKTALGSLKTPDDNLINFTKEQAWAVDFESVRAERKPFYQVIKTTGQILPAQGDEKIVSAISSGIIIMGSNRILPGIPVSKGNSLFSISGSRLTEKNVDVKYLEAKYAFEKKNNEFERAKALIKDKVISEKEYMEIKTEYENCKIVYDNIAKSYSSGGIRVITPLSGYIKNVFVNEGQYVEEGQPLITVVQNKRLTVRADVPRKYFSDLSKIYSANFRTDYDDKVYDIKDLGGSMVSYGKGGSDGSFFIPVFFEIDNIGDIISGSYVEIFLKANLIEKALVIPWSALLEEYGNYFVYRQAGGESFVKTPVKTGFNDGGNVQILKGLEENDRVITKGKYRIKIASFSKALTSHGHVH